MLIWMILIFYTLEIKIYVVFFYHGVLTPSKSFSHQHLYPFLNSTVLPLSAHIQMLMVIQEYWVSLSGDKSDRLICPVRGWGVIGHI